MISHPLETLVSTGGVLLLALLSCLLLPAPAFTVSFAKQLIQTFHLQDLNQLYTIIFCIWFLILGVIEYAVIRFIWRRWLSGEHR